jgi:hypothetical protein
MAVSAALGPAARPSQPGSPTPSPPHDGRTLHSPPVASASSPPTSGCVPGKQAWTSSEGISCTDTIAVPQSASPWLPITEAPTKRRAGHLGAILGGCLGAIAFVAALVALALCTAYRRRRIPTKPSPTTSRSLFRRTDMECGTSSSSTLHYLAGAHLLRTGTAGPGQGGAWGYLPSPLGHSYDPEVEWFGPGTRRVDYDFAIHEVRARLLVP